jgi:Tfp pilus assembly protein PilF
VGRWRSKLTSRPIATVVRQALSLMLRRRLLAPCLRRHLAIVSLCVLTCYGCTTAHRQRAQVNQATDHYNRALQFLSAESGEQAIKELNEAVKIEPSNAEFFNLLAFAYHYEGRYDFALAHYRKALELAPGYAEAHVNLSALYLDLGRWDDAVHQVRQALNISTYQSREKAYNNIGLAYIGKGDLVSARRAFRDALDFHKNFPEAHRNLGTVYFLQGHTEDAIQQFREALRIRPSYAEALHDLGVAYLEDGRTVEAVAQFQKVIQLDPESELAEKAKLHLGALP